MEDTEIEKKTVKQVIEKKGSPNKTKKNKMSEVHKLTRTNSQTEKQKRVEGRCRRGGAEGGRGERIGSGLLE